MKIYVNARFLTQPISGVQRYAIECSRKIKKLHHDVVFLAPPHIIDNDLGNELGVVLIGKNKGHLWEQLDLPRYLKGKKTPPLLNLCNTAPALYANNFLTLHDLAFYFYPGWNNRLFSLWYNRLVPFIVKRCKGLFTVSNTVRQEIATNYRIPQSFIDVTYNGVSEKMMQSRQPETQAKEKQILTVGSFNIRKNHHQLIKAFLQSDIRHNYKLILVADKNKVFKETGVDEQKLLENNIVLHKYLSEEELIRLYQHSEIVVSLSIYEGFGIPVLEGIFNYCKVLCSDIPVYRELYSEAAIFCNQNDTLNIVEAFSQIIATPPPSTELIDSLVAKYNYELSAKIMLNRILKT